MLLAKKRSLGDVWSFSSLADYCRIQKTYLSRVLNGDAHLSLDQLFLALEFLDVNQDERHYTELLHHWERSDVPKRKSQLQADIDELRQKHIRTERFLSRASDLTNVKGADAYYLDPNAQLVHLFLTIPKYASSPTQLTKKLGISEDTLRSILDTLQQLGLVVIDATKIEVVRQHLHLSRNSNWINPYRILTRVKALEHLQRGSMKDNYVYSLFFSADEDARAKIKAKFFSFLQEVEQLVQSADCKNVYQMHFDLLDWGQ